MGQNWDKIGTKLGQDGLGQNSAPKWDKIGNSGIGGTAHTAARGVPPGPPNGTRRGLWDRGSPRTPTVPLDPDQGVAGGSDLGATPEEGMGVAIRDRGSGRSRIAYTHPRTIGACSDRSEGPAPCRRSDPWASRGALDPLCYRTAYLRRMMDKPVQSYGPCPEEEGT